MKFKTNHGSFGFNIWDVPGERHYDVLGTGKKYDGVLIMVDPSSYDKISELQDMARALVGDKYIVCSNKTDLLSPLVRAEVEMLLEGIVMINARKDKDQKLYQPFVELGRLVTGLPDLNIEREQIAMIDF
jgi:G3E family GTPase